MRSMEFSGRNIDEAIFHGLNEMGLTIDEVDTEIVQRESKGLFGIGAKNAIVRLTEREVPVVPDFEAEKAAAHERKSERKRNEGERRERSDRKPRNDRREQGGRREKEPQAPAIAYSAELAKENDAAIFLSELLEHMKIEATVEAAETEDGLRLNILSATDGLLIGRRGETLDALQYIVSLYMNKDRKENGYRRVSVDTEGYRARREETLRRLARKNAAQVARTGRSVAMEPMNPYERRVLHSALQGFKGVTTHSEGEEPNRRVIITPDK
ncbi:MAG: Jag N-terminal domain-containing protein [Clostridia bacterium]|nr:Jag N-terminal domain-containing protein [Clostridia bacterium]